MPFGKLERRDAVQAMIVDGTDAASLAQAARALRAGALVGLPTETVYGLAADAENPQAVARIFSAKGRPVDHPLIVHVADAAAVPHFAQHVPSFAQQLMAAFWPGPLTLILPRRPGVAAAAAGGQASIGLRCPAHPVALALLRACQAPAAGTAATALERLPSVYGLAAPSANQHGRVSPTTAAHVQNELGADLLILDGGACQVGIESSIVDCTRGAPVLLRPGAVSAAQIQAVCGMAVLSVQSAGLATTPRAPGTLASHYAPRAKVRLLSMAEMQTALRIRFAQTASQAAGLALYTRSTPPPLAWKVAQQRRMPHDAKTAAQQLFAVLRELDDAKVQEIWVETPPVAAAWDAVRDRLQRAAA